MQKTNHHLLLLALALTSAFHLFAQKKETTPALDNAILDDKIKTVQMVVSGGVLAYPIVDLKAANNTLTLGFDHLGSDLKDYLYTIQHCDSEWKPSTSIDDNEYISGFTEDRVFDFYNSFNTLQPYVHYTIRLPNANMRWMLSGNYVLKVFDNDNDRKLVLVRRFSVVEQLWSAEAKFVRASSVLKSDTHHEIDFIVNTKNTRIAFPAREVKAYVLQNGRWDNCVGPLTTPLLRQNQLVFDFQDSIVFEGNKEWRFFNIRTFDFRGENVQKISTKPNMLVVNLSRDVNRAVRPYSFMPDIDGRYIIDNTTQGQSVQQCDYAEVIFWFPMEVALPDKDVYVFGELSDWQIKPEFEMYYDNTIKAYVGNIILKQGYYNYQYATVSDENPKPDLSTLEGNSFEAANRYFIFVYYKPFGQRYDRLVSVTNLDSGWGR
jgi:Domain of unknown function (DUF5103)